MFSCIPEGSYFRCVSTLQPQTFSNHRDAIFFSIFVKHPWFASNLLSVRSCGCEARIIIMVDTGHYLDDAFLEVVNATKSEIFFFDYDKSIYTFTDNARAIWQSMWLKSHKGEIDRIITVDAFDVFFQSDPFETMVYPDKMTLVTEGIKIKDQKTNYRWIAECFGKEGAESVKDGYVICFGTVAGPYHIYMQFLNFFLRNLTAFTKCLRDQPQLNYYVHTGAFDRENLKYQFQDCSGSVLSLSFCPRVRTWIWDGLLPLYEMSAKYGHVSPLVHHTKSRKYIMWNFQYRCNVDKFHKFYLLHNPKY